MPMSLRKGGAVLALLMSSPAFGQTPDLPPQNEASVAPDPLTRPVSIRPAPVPAGTTASDLRSFLDPQSEMDRRRMLDKQQRTFQLEIDGRYAKALKAYCDTGYGDDRCFRPEVSRPVLPAVPLPAPVVNTGGAVSSSNPSKSHEARELPAVAQISGFGEDLSAVLVFAGGKRLRVMGPGPNGPRSQLPDGETVISIRPGEVLVSRPGDAKPVPLLFQSAAGYGGTE